MLWNFFLIAIGLFSSFILFAKFPILKRGEAKDLTYKVSVIIPARNEEKNLGLLLADLQLQDYNIHEVICVDDCSTDNTYNIASSFNVNILRIYEKPEDWAGKAWACKVGSEAATGDLLLFLDADVRLNEYAISSLVHEYNKSKSTISLLPYHQMEKPYEEFSLFFNIIQIAGNGTTMPSQEHTVGLYGAVILISRTTYDLIGGHGAAQKSNVDDLAIGERLRKLGFPFKLFLGGEAISMRMYGESFKSLFWGWTKNYATGALKANLLILTLAFIWVQSCISIVILFFQSIMSFNTSEIIICVIFYIFWVLELKRISKKIGNFKVITIVTYPIYLGFFVLVFFISLFKKIFKLDANWKGRKIKMD